MPQHEYVRGKCHRQSGEVLMIKEHETKRSHCPKCESTEVEKVNNNIETEKIMISPLEITFRHMKTSDAVAARIRAEVLKLDRYYGRITSCRVIV